MKVSKVENLTEFLLEVKEKMAQIVYSNDPDISSINAYISKHPGKLIRSKIIQIFGSHLGIKKVKMLELATASELIHLSTLIHDDIIDEADLRRGNKTIIRKWGLKQALLYGDYLYTKTFSTLNSLDNQKIAKRLIDCAEELIEGEFIQIKYHQQEVPSLSKYMEIVDKKTGALFKGMLECIGLELNFNVKKLLKLGELGREFGFAFQLNDDLADFQEEKITGKESFKDLSEGKYTFPIISSIKNMPELEQKNLFYAIDSKNYDFVYKKLVEFEGFKSARQARDSSVQKCIKYSKDLIGLDDSEFVTEYLTTLLKA